MVDRPRASSTAGAAAVQRAAIACRNCRQRKVKASRASPAQPARGSPSPTVWAISVSVSCDAQPDRPDEGCGPCRRAGKECLLDPMSDGRRSVNRKCVDRLQQRIEMLEARSQIVSDRAGWEPNEDGILHHVPPPPPPPPEYTPMLLSGGPRSTQSTNTTDTIPPPPPPHHAHPPHPLVSTRVEPAPASTSGSSPGCSSTSHGSPSFYGATSHPHVVSAGEDAPLPLLDEAEAGIGIDLDPMSPHLRAHLFQSFFKYQTLWVDVVDREAFLSHPADAGSTPSRWRSAFLENAMLACGTRLSTSRSVRALGPRYCDWARDDVLRAMSDPTPANLQGFLLLSEYEVTQGNDRPAWMYCGVACRMLSDLGLHELAMADGPGAEAGREGDLAYALLSACVVYEGVWTLYLGRPSSIPPAVMSTAAARCRQRRRADTPWLNAWVGLCVPMAEITRLLNEKAAGGGGSGGDADADGRRAALRGLARQVEDWYEGLPPELAFHEDRLINMHLAGYGLHAQHCKIQILLRQALAARPSSAKAGTNPRKRPHAQMEGGDARPAPASPLDDANVAYHYGLRIARLVVTYREAFGMEQIPSIMLDNAVVAATAMIRHHNASSSSGSSSSSSSSNSTETIWLRQLLKSLESVQPHFPIIARMLDSLKQICGSGPLMHLLPPRRGSTDTAHALDVLDFGSVDSRSNMTHSSLGLGGGPDLLWDCFDGVITPGIFQAGGYGDSVLDLPPPSEVLGSVLAQAVS